MFYKISIVLASLLLFSALSPLPLNAGERTGSRQSSIYRQYLARAYYCKSPRDVANYFVERTREYYESLTGEDAVKEVKKIRKSYIAKFVVTREETVGDMHYMKGTGLASDYGKVLKCTVAVEMLKETGGWKIMKHGWSSRMRIPRSSKKPRLIK